MSIFAAAMRYRAGATCRWWCWPARSTAPARHVTEAAKGPRLLGVRAVIAESLRAYPPYQPGLHGYPAACSSADGGYAGVPGPDRHAKSFTSTASATARRSSVTVRAVSRRRQGNRSFLVSACASTRRRKSSTTVTAASFTMCCVSWLPVSWTCHHSLQFHPSTAVTAARRREACARYSASSG